MREEFLDVAASHVGYQARPGLISYYGATVGYDGHPWAGAFVDVVARESGVSMPACVYSPSGLAEFIKLRRWHARPRPGDIVFFTFPTLADDGFSAPHVGIVTGTTDWDKLGRLETIEGNTDSGTPRGPRSRDGVYRRVRYRYEVLGFGRPAFTRARETGDGSGLPMVKLSNLQTGRPHKHVEIVQLALGKLCGLRYAKPGVLDGQTTSAYARWQRMIGFTGPDVTGVPDLASLKRLARDSGVFTVQE